MAKRRRGMTAHQRANTLSGAQHLVQKVADDLGIGILVSTVVDGPPCRITAFLNFGNGIAYEFIEGILQATMITVNQRQHIEIFYE